MVRADSLADALHLKNEIAARGEIPFLDARRVVLLFEHEGDRAKGWPAELLWNADFWDPPRELAAVLDPDDGVAEVAAEYKILAPSAPKVIRGCYYFHGFSHLTCHRSTPFPL